METQPNTENVVYLDEYRKQRWLTQLRCARENGHGFLFNQDLDGLAVVLPFPTPEEGPTDAA